ncbi:winged helix-turn-helix transcriptional regulator [Sphaerisporangium sp. B11E5]|uniref:winged helix-turn-helix transcriptional regulator n=1 Tax=Sphaerisporangium sp. B11E5 TaxID=3153563 RepID=UPI00325EE2F5
MLTVASRHLERDGLISRTVHSTVPPQVEDDLTGAGRRPRGGRALDGQASRRDPYGPGGAPWPLTRRFLTKVNLDA